MINFKKEEERYQQILLIKSVLKDFRAYDVIRQAQIDLMYHFNIFISPRQTVSLYLVDKVMIKVNSIGIGHFKPYKEIAHLITSITYDNKIKADFKKEYTFRGVTFIIDDYVMAEIPEEELILLELLGKVTVTVIEAQPSTITKSIFCPSQIPQSPDLPF